MQIVHHGLRLNLKRAHQVIERLAEELEAGEVFEIAQMLALVDEASARQRKHILQMAANGQQRRRIERQRNTQRNKAARAANAVAARRRPPPRPSRRSAAESRGRASGTRRQLRPGARGLRRCRWRWALRSDWRWSSPGPGRARRQRANAAAARRAERCRARECRARRKRQSPIAIAALGKHDGPRRRGEQRFFRFGQLAEVARRIEIAHHHGQRLSVAVLALAQPHHRSFVGRIDAQMKSADALDGQNLAGGEAVDGCGNRIVGRNRLHRPRRRAQTCGPHSQQALGCA